MRNNITKGFLAVACVSVLSLLAGTVAWYWSTDDEKRRALAADTYGDQLVGTMDPNVSLSSQWSKDGAWQATVDYAHGSGKIEVDLSNSEAEHQDRMKVHANFKSGPKVYGGGNWLTRGPDGIFRSDEVELPKGQYTLGLTGYDQSRFTFRIEKTLVVE